MLTLFCFGDQKQGKESIVMLALLYVWYIQGSFELNAKISMLTY